MDVIKLKEPKWIWDECNNESKQIVAYAKDEVIGGFVYWVKEDDGGIQIWTIQAVMQDENTPKMVDEEWEAEQLDAVGEAFRRSGGLIKNVWQLERFVNLWARKNGKIKDVKLLTYGGYDEYRKLLCDSEFVHDLLREFRYIYREVTKKE